MLANGGVSAAGVVAVQLRAIDMPANYTTRHTADKHGNFWGMTIATAICLRPARTSDFVALRDFCKTLEEK